MRHLIVVFGLTLNVVSLLARESHGAFFLPRQLLNLFVQRERQTASETPSSKKHVSSIQFACLLHCELEELGNHLEHVAINICNLESTAAKL